MRALERLVTFVSDDIFSIMIIQRAKMENWKWVIWRNSGNGIGWKAYEHLKMCKQWSIH